MAVFERGNGDEHRHYMIAELSEGDPYCGLIAVVSMDDVPRRSH